MAKDLKPKPFLVTGAAGFIGARLVEHLNQLGAELISVDKKGYFSDRPEHQGLSFGKILDIDELFAWLSSEKPALSAVLHLGACTDTTEMDRDFLHKVNVEYSQKLWNYCSHEQTPLVYASSAATYGDGSLGYDDDESQMMHLKPLNPYGDSKLEFDLWALDQEKLGNAPSSWSGFKFFNVYGFGERHKNKMSSVVLQSFDRIRKSGRAQLFQSHRKDIAHGQQQRDFIYVEDLVDVLMFALDKPLARGIYNLGSGQARSFLDLAHATFAAMKLEPQIDFVPTPEVLRPRYQYFTQANMQKLRQAGYRRDFTSLEDGVAATIQRLTRRN